MEQPKKPNKQEIEEIIKSKEKVIKSQQIVVKDETATPPLPDQ